MSSVCVSQLPVSCSSLTHLCLIPWDLCKQCVRSCSPCDILLLPCVNPSHLQMTCFNITRSLMVLVCFLFFSFIDWLTRIFFFLKQFMSIKGHTIKYSNTGDIGCFREKQQAGSHLCRFCPSKPGLVEVSKVDTRMKRNLNKSTKFTSTSPQITAFFLPTFLVKWFWDWLEVSLFYFINFFKVSVYELLRPCLYCFSNPAWTNQLIL